LRLYRTPNRIIHGRPPNHLGFLRSVIVGLWHMAVNMWSINAEMALRRIY